MVLLSQLFRTAAITGRSDAVDATWFAGRQGGRWAEQTIAAAMPAAARSPSARPPADPAETLQELTELHRRRVVTDAEFERLRARLSG
jgi:hypothetical protein